MIFTTAAATKFGFDTADTAHANSAYSPILLDLSQPDQAPLQWSHRVDFNHIVSSCGDTVGLVPSIEALNQALAHTGICADRTLYIVDDCQGLAASRLAWTLALCGHTQSHLVDGGRTALLAAGMTTNDHPRPAESTPNLSFIADEHACTAEMILAGIQQTEQPWLVVDARSEAEYLGLDRRSRHAGHIPGAIHFDWQTCFDPANPGFLLPDTAILAKLAERGISPDTERTIAVYCQSHRRSSFLFFMLKHLGFKHVRGYPGAWSDWGNRDDLPIKRLIENAASTA